MIDFTRWYFTWKNNPIERNPYYKYPGFEGRYGAAHRVQIQLDLACTLTNKKTGEKEWCYEARGRDRFELHDPSNTPEGYPPENPKPIFFPEVSPHKTETILLASGT